MHICIRNVCFSNAFLSDSYFDNADAEGADFNHAFWEAVHFMTQIFKELTLTMRIWDLLCLLGQFFKALLQ